MIKIFLFLVNFFIFIHIFRYNLWPHTMIIVWLFILYFILAITNQKNSKISVLIYSLTLIISIFIMAPLATSYGIQIRLMLIYYIIFFIAVMQQFYDNQSTTITLIYKFFKKILYSLSNSFNNYSGSYGKCLLLTL